MRPYDERFSALLSHAARVFAGRGYDRTSMRDLAAASRMSLAGIYYYVRGKEDEATVDPEERLAAFIRHHVTFFAAHMPEMKVLSHEALALSGERLRKVNQIKRRYVNLLERLLNDVTPERPPLERSAATYALFGMMNWIYNWYDPAGPLDAGHLADLLTRIFLGGFAEARSPVTGGS
jgi:AcrR family transcriptional regulator